MASPTKIKEEVEDFETKEPEEEIYSKHFEAGFYTCKECNSILYSSKDKFDTTWRWPSFRKAFEVDGYLPTTYETDWSSGAPRTKILCKKVHPFRI
jgi:peptide methionine sulfoxide reductase MsrB